ncbi:PAK1IP1 [Branchiostoma lanceolatum]|uniref:PAK1IP1 protein n=1 Tax=Branchiostoma lanceolatum TaxID=7740 RepID=A0A8K0EMH0_BRALA|nr:PAK1IP1 [Branchiostoma lanceolatum]
MTSRGEHMSDDKMEVVVGCYEQMLLGFRLVVGEEECKLEPTFTDNSHTGCVKAVASGGHVLASGSTDETIHLYNMESRTELGTLLQHDGSITCLQFYDSSHMLSGAEDGTMCVWQTGTWECLKSMRGHKGGISSLSVHPSGKLALSVGKDKTIRTWNLVTGRPAYTTNIKQVADLIQWSPKGDMYAVVTGNKISVYRLETAGLKCTLDAGKRVLTVAYLTNTVLAVAGEDKNIQILNVETGTCTCDFSAHDNRIKSLLCVRDHRSDAEETDLLMVSISSDGYIKVWALKTDQLEKTPTLLAKHNTTARLTALAIVTTQSTAPERSTTKAVPEKRKLAEQKEAEQKTEKRKNVKEKKGGKKKLKVKN